jgi:hypothetical protein
VFVLGSHSKKRPHNLTLGRLYDFHLYDCLELGVEHHRPIKAFKGAGTAQVGNKVRQQQQQQQLAVRGNVGSSSCSGDVAWALGLGCNAGPAQCLVPARSGTRSGTAPPADSHAAFRPY